MSKKYIGFLLFLLVFCIFAVGAELMAGDYDGPRIENFAINEGKMNMIKISFSYSEIRGGLEASTFTIGYRIERDKKVMEENIETNLVISPDPKVVSKMSKVDNSENGEFTANIPFFKTKQSNLKSGDKIKYVIFLIDSSGRKSNTVFYEYLFVEKYDI
ncbi:MAG: hypothetical protein DDT19_02897 [Syntrophomonadaceae bacterium]|nr:hypothetical protein [Bacillota bacterium]